ncbi:MAG: aminoacyl--tRNA ligase-related protein [bacterium]|nr:aminoacyl--tRNA ligase-related protein [bacterium]
MRLSQLFSKTIRDFPKEEEAVNAKLLIKAGYIRKLSAGVYAYLPLAWRVLNKINNIIREEMNAIGGQELLMPTLVAKEYWEKSGRWDVDVAFKTQLPTSKSPEFALGWTHEEAVTYLATNFISSYQDLPMAAYQIQTKFRAEARAKNGLLRGREFLMKDLYSFHTDQADLDNYYQKVIDAYKKIMDCLSLNKKYLIAEADGGPFTKEYTHEFQVLAPAGEDEVFYCDGSASPADGSTLPTGVCDFAQNKEISNVKVGDECPRHDGIIQKANGIEVANVFKLGTRYSDAFNLKFKDKAGVDQPVIMGSYGVGPTRLMGALVEVYNDDRGIIWPESVAPYSVYLASLGTQNKKVAELAEKLYTDFSKVGIEVLFDDRDVSAGQKLADADLLGITWRVVVSEKTGNKIEMKARNLQEVKLLSIKEAVNLLSR